MRNICTWDCEASACVLMRKATHKNGIGSKNVGLRKFVKVGFKVRSSAQLSSAVEVERVSVYQVGTVVDTQ